MNEQIENILKDLQNTTSNLDVILDAYQENLDYFNEDDRRKINDFKSVFEHKREAIEIKINSFVRFVEKSFAPSHEEIIQTKALKKLRDDFPCFDSWDEAVKRALIEREVKSFAVCTSSDIKIIKKPTTGDTVYTDNPNLEVPHSITEDFVFCKPYKIELSDDSYSVKNWRDVMCTIGNALYTNNPNPLKNYIANDRSARPKFSYNIEKYHRQPIQISTDVYAEANLNAPDMIALCKLLLQIYKVDYSNVKIYLSKIAKKRE